MSLVAALILVSGQLGDLAHKAFVQHRVCAEHGEQVHADSTPRAPADSADTRTDSSRLAYLPGDAPGDDAHEHCNLGSLTHKQAHVAATSTATPAPMTNASAVPPRVAVVARATYRVAPKQSPPV